MRWKALAEIYTMHSFAPSSKLKFLLQNLWKFCQNFTFFLQFYCRISLDQDQDQVSWNREKVFENSLEGEDVARFSISHASTISPVIGIRSFSVRSLFSSAASPAFSGTPLSRLSRGSVIPDASKSHCLEWCTPLSLRSSGEISLFARLFDLAHTT